MKMKNIILLIIIFSPMVLLSQITIDDSVMNSIEFQNESYLYVGNGQFMALRSCRIPWIDVKFLKIYYNFVNVSTITTRFQVLLLF